MNTRFEQIIAEWKNFLLKTIKSSTMLSRLETGDLDICHYKGYLQETYHHAGFNPQIQVFASCFFNKDKRKITSQFFTHAKQEIGHDLLALNDLTKLGEDKNKVINSNPLPSTVALNAYPIYQILFKDPLSYLGYLIHLEFMPTLNGDKYINTLKSLGIPENALSFLAEHSEVDLLHNEMMKGYIEELVTTDKDAETVVQAAKDTAVLHEKMLTDAIKNGEKIFIK